MTREPGLLDRVLTSWEIPPARPGTLESLDVLHDAYLHRVPFENATKLIKVARLGTGGAAVRGPVEFWEDHLRWGSGGTCFAATSAFRFLLRYAGYACRMVFCQLPAEANDAHAALLVETEAGDVLADVGYALPAPLRLSATAAVRRETPYYDLELRPGPQGEYLVFSEDARGTRFRYRVVPEPVSEDAYEAAWRRTFRADAPYMTRLALGRFAGGKRYLYKSPHAVYEIGREGETARALPASPAPALSDQFGLPLPLLETALSSLDHLTRQGS